MRSFSSHCIVKTNQRGFGYGSEAQGEKSRFDSLDKISQAEWEKKISLKKSEEELQLRSIWKNTN